MVENNTNLTPASGRRPVAWVDLDDTIWDFHANSRIALRGLYDAYSLSQWFPAPQDWIECYERHNHALWAQYSRGEIEKPYLMRERFLRPLAEADSPRADELWPIFDKEYLDRLARCTMLVDGAIPLLQRLRARGYAIGILSNGFVEVQHRKIRNSGLTPYIDYIVLSDDIGVNKPDVRLFRHAEAVAGVTPGECIMIGDNPDTDIAGAVNAGWRALFFDRAGSGAPVSDGVPRITSLDAVDAHLG